MEGFTIGVFGTDPAQKTAFESSIAKKSEGEGIIVYHRVESGKRFSFLDDAEYPERIQGYGRIASICDCAHYLFPKTSRLTPADGELAVLLESFRLPGSIEMVDGPAAADPRAFFKGTVMERYPVEQRTSQTSIIDLSAVKVGPAFPASGTLIYIDRCFAVKGVGVVVLGFVLSGNVSVHDKLRGVGAPEGKVVEVRGIQINDEDFDTSGRGIRVGLSLKGIEVKDLEKTSWLQDGSFPLAERLVMDFDKSPFYKQSLDGRDLHLQLPGELIPARLTGTGGRLTCALPSKVPLWSGMRVAVIDLNARNLRVAGGGSCVI